MKCEARNVCRERKFKSKTFDLRFLAKKIGFRKNRVIFLVENDSAPKMLWVQRNLEFKEIWAEKIRLILNNYS